MPMLAYFPISTEEKSAWFFLLEHNESLWEPLKCSETYYILSLPQVWRYQYAQDNAGWYNSATIVEAI